jgi:soluble lytic murein transglycosylase
VSENEVQLRLLLDAKDRELKTLKDQIELSGDLADFKEAQRLKVDQAVKASGLPERQQRRLAAAIIRESRRNKLDPLLTVAVIRVESSFNNYAQSHVGARGLMQVMPETGKWLLEKRGERLPRSDHLFDYELNIELGTAYLASLIRQFGDVDEALVAYNAGPTAARRILGDAAKRTAFISGYPRKVLGEFDRLKGDGRAKLAAASPAKFSN